VLGTLMSVALVFFRRSLLAPRTTAA
jgi:hypothetical protein